MNFEFNTQPVQTPQQPQPPTPIINQNLVSPVITYVLLAITVVTYLLQMGTQLLFRQDIPALLGMKINDSIAAGQFWRFLTPMFLHGSLLHIGFNMYALLIIGSNIEKRFGHLRFFVLYCLGSIGGNVFSFLFSPNPSLGASTAIFGLLGAQMVFFYQNQKMLGNNARRALQNVITVAVINFIIGLSPGIDNWGHLGGLIGGLIFTWFGGPKLDVEGIFPYLNVIDERTPKDQFLGAFLVIFLFGTLAALKILNLTPN